MSRRLVQTAFGLGCALLFLGFALYRVSPAAIGAVLANADPVWLGAAFLVYALNLALRAWRWQVILRPAAAIPYPLMARALVVGYGLNTILPARLGEICRAEYVNRSCGLSRTSALTSIVVERLFDGLMVVACLGLGLLLAAARPDSGALGDVLTAGAAVFGAIAVAAVWLAGQSMTPLLRRMPRLARQLTMVQQGFAILRTPRIAAVAGLTVIVYLPDALSLWCVVKAAGLGLGLADTLVLVGAASLSTLLPSGPAFVGPLQFAYALALEFAGASRALGIAAATLAQLCLLLPVALAGAAFLLHRSGRLFYAALIGGQKSGLPPAAAPERTI